VSAATGRISQRGSPYASLVKISSAGLNGWARNSSAASIRHISSFSGRCIGRGIGLGASGASLVTKLGCSGPAAGPRDHLAWIQVRKFSQTDPTKLSSDKKRTQGLLEKFEVQEGNQEARPQRTVLGENGKEGKWPERMTKGKKVLLWLL
jgi:hypothetical protein